jgi:hypothetical protein
MKMNKQERINYLEKRIERLAKNLYKAGFPEFEIGYAFLKESLLHITDNNQTALYDMDVSVRAYNGEPDLDLQEVLENISNELSHFALKERDKSAEKYMELLHNGKRV